MDIEDIAFSVFDFLDSSSVSHFLITCRRHKRLLHQRTAWWEERVNALYHCRERRLPEFENNPGKAFLRLTAYRQCFSCLRSAPQRHRFYLFRLCYLCQRRDLYRMVSQSCALSEYKVRRKDLINLYCVHAPNTFYNSARPIKLYLLSDIQSID